MQIHSWELSQSLLHKNNTLNTLSPLGTLTLNSSSIPWVEPVVSFNGALTQSIALNGPARMNAPTFGPQAAIVGPSRIAITNSLTVTSSFQFAAPVQLYVSTQAGSFTFTLSNTGTYLTFATTPSLFNPLGFNLATQTNFIFNAASLLNIIKFNLNTAFTAGDLTVNSGTLQLTSSTTTSNIVNVAKGATLWIDGNAFSCSQIVFSQNNDGTSPSYYQLTVSSLTPPAITTQNVVYKGVASVVVVNFNWDGTAVRGITSTSSNGGDFSSVIGTPGFTYTSTKVGNSINFGRSANPTSSPSPTQSNGPSPAVSSSTTIFINFAFLVIILMISLF